MHLISGNLIRKGYLESFLEVLIISEKFAIRVRKIIDIIDELIKYYIQGSVVTPQLKPYATVLHLFVTCVILTHACQVSDAQLPASPGTPADTTSNIPTNPFGGAYEQPPRIIMIYNNTEYQGALDSYSFGKTESVMALPIPEYNVTRTLPNQTVIIEKNSTLWLVMEGIRPSEAMPDGISAAAYTTNGKPAGVLKVVDEPKEKKGSPSVLVDLELGQYILLTTAIWLPQENNQISGYVSYSYRINVV